MKISKRIVTVFITVLTAAVILCQTAASAMPYVASDTVVITFKNAPESNVSCEILNTYSGNTLQALKVKNNGGVPVTVRLRAAGNWVNDENIIVGQWSDDSLVIGENWTKDGDSFVYSGVLQPGETTDSLFDYYTPETRDDGAHLELSFTAQADKAEANNA